MDLKAFQLFKQEMGDEANPDLCIRSKARVDTGLWLMRSPMWICVVGEELVMLAIARRRYFARKRIADCAKSYYNHATGEFVVEIGDEADGLQFHQFPMSPRNALSLLAYFKKYKSNANPGNATVHSPDLGNLSQQNTTKQKIC